MPKAGKPKIQNYGLDFKLRAVQLSSQPGVLIKDVAESLCIHPFMLSRWRKQVRDGVLKGKPPDIEPDAVSELQRLRQVEKQYKRLLMEQVPTQRHCAAARAGKRTPRGAMPLRAGQLRRYRAP